MLSSSSHISAQLVSSSHIILNVVHHCTIIASSSWCWIMTQSIFLYPTSQAMQSCHKQKSSLLTFMISSLISLEKGDIDPDRYYYFPVIDFQPVWVLALLLSARNHPWSPSPPHDVTNPSMSGFRACSVSTLRTTPEHAIPIGNSNFGLHFKFSPMVFVFPSDGLGDFLPFSHQLREIFCLLLSSLKQTTFVIPCCRTQLCHCSSIPIIQW